MRARRSPRSSSRCCRRHGRQGRLLVRRGRRRPRRVAHPARRPLGGRAQGGDRQGGPAVGLHLHALGAGRRHRRRAHAAPLGPPCGEAPEGAPRDAAAVDRRRRRPLRLPLGRAHGQRRQARRRHRRGGRVPRRRRPAGDGAQVAARRRLRAVQGAQPRVGPRPRARHRPRRRPLGGRRRRRRRRRAAVRRHHGARGRLRRRRPALHDAREGVLDAPVNPSGRRR